MSQEVKIQWFPLNDPRNYFTGGFVVELPPGRNPFDFLRHHGKFGEDQQRLQVILGCDQCPMLGKFPAWADNWIRPEIGTLLGEEESQSGYPTVDISCEGTKRMAKGKGVCPPRFRNGKTIEVEID